MKTSGYFTCPMHPAPIYWKRVSNQELSGLKYLIDLTSVMAKESFILPTQHRNTTKTCAPELAAPRAMLFQYNYNTGIHPTIWKLAQRLPAIYKAQIRSVTEYTPHAWMCAAPTILKKLDTVQDKVAHST
eukprot:g47641.t1